MSTEKRNIDGYIELESFKIAGRIVVLAENTDNDMSFLVCNIRRDNPFNIEESYDGVVTGDYFEAVGEVTKRINDFATAIEAERRQSGLPRYILTAADCIPDSNKMDWEGNAVIIKPEILSPEYRSVEYQVVLAIGGFGCDPKAGGNAVYVKEILGDKQYRQERYNIMGLADPNKMPEWVNTAIAKLQSGEEVNNARPTEDFGKKDAGKNEKQGSAGSSTLAGQLAAAKAQAERQSSKGAGNLKKPPSVDAR